MSDVVRFLPRAALIGLGVGIAFVLLALLFNLAGISLWNVGPGTVGGAAGLVSAMAFGNYLSKKPAD